MAKQDLSIFDNSERVTIQIISPQDCGESDTCDRCETDAAASAKLVLCVPGEASGHLSFARVKRLHVRVADEFHRTYAVCGQCGNIRQIDEGPELAEPPDDGFDC